MRNSHTCPKCAHNEVLFVPSVSDTDHDVLAVHTTPGSTWDGSGRESFGQIEAYICRSCGYTELYTANPTDIPVYEIEGAKVLVAAAPAPYR